MYRLIGKLSMPTIPRTRVVLDFDRNYNSSRLIMVLTLIASLLFSIPQIYCQDLPANSTHRITNCSVIGKIVEESTETPLELASAILFNATDNVQVSGTTTDEDGGFAIDQLPAGKYYLQVSYVGFVTLQTEIFQLDSGMIDLGVLEVELSPLLGGTIVVKGERATFNNSIDRKIYNVGNDVLSNTGSATDVLQNIPSVTVDVNGNVSLRGSANVTFFVNGKPSLLMRKNSTAVLEQMPASSIEWIEVITNPSAKYKPDGVGGIINIVLKKESREGLNGTVIANAGNKDRYNGSLALNYKPGTVNVFGSYGLRRTNSPRISTDSRISKDSLSRVTSYYDYNGSSSAKPLTHIVTAGLDYSLSEKDQLGVSGNYFYRNSYHTVKSQTTYRDSGQQATSSLTTDRTNDEFEEEYEVSSSYEHDFDKEDHVLQFELNYSGYDEKEDNHYNDSYTVPVVSDVLSHNLIKKGGELIELYAEYSHPISDETQLEAGYVGEFLKDDIRYVGEDYDTLQERWITDFNKTNRFLFHQNIHAFYATLGHSIHKFGFSAGLRAEQALITSNLVTADSTVPNDYFRLYPTLHLVYELSDHQELQLSYSRRVNRADSDEHNPFAEYTDPRNLEAGNPNIKPEQIHSLELGFHLRNENYSVLPSIYYRYKYDAFTEIQRFVNDSTMLTTFDNLANDQSAGLEIIVSGGLRQYLSLNVSANAFYHLIDASNLGYSDNKSIVSWNGKLGVNLYVVKASLVQINAYYRSTRLTPQGEYDPLFLINLGVRHDIFGNKAALTLTVSDLFNVLEWTSNIDTRVLYDSATYKRDSRIIYLGFIYHFGSSKNDSKEDLQFEDKI